MDAEKKSLTSSNKYVLLFALRLRRLSQRVDDFVDSDGTIFTSPNPWVQFLSLSLSLSLFLFCNLIFLSLRLAIPPIFSPS